VRYLLQSASDPSLLIPAEEVFSARGGGAALLRERGFDAREHLLASLGQAAGIDSRIEASLRDDAPAGYALDTEGAFEFLSARAVGLEQAGFGILLPAWWSRRGTRSRLTLRAAAAPRPAGGGGLGLDEVVQFQWRVAVGGETLTRAELEELARIKAPLVRVRGRWVQMSSGEIEAALRFWDGDGKASATLREVVALALGARKPPGHLAFDGVEGEGAVGDLLAKLESHASVDELGQPDGFHGVLRPYQLRGYSWMEFLGRLGFGACLADDMGLGKTVQALALVQRHWNAGCREPALLVCPMSVVGNWQKEAARFTPELPVLVHHGLSRSRGASFSRDAARHALVVSSYSLLHRDLPAFQSVRWSGVILDEAQNVKNAETQQARAARSLAASYRVALTGTPVENNVADLWSIMEFLNPGLLGTQAEFKRSFLVPIHAGRDAEAVSRLKRLTAPFVLRRLKTDRSIIVDLPEKMEMKVFCNLTREQASLYQAVLDEAAREMESAEGIRRKGVVLATLARLKQVCNHPAHLLADNSPLPGRSGKLARLTEMLEEVLEEGDRALVFTQFAEMGALLQRHLQESFGRETLFLHGGTAKAERDRMVDRFQGEADAPRLFVLSLTAGGVGLNLTAASHVFHYDRWWNPAVEAQATDRAFRIGQNRRVQVRKLLSMGTLEEKVDEMIESKKGLAESVIGTGEGWLTELTTRELREVLALRPEAIAE
jgi:SNF2 family DNA or RNA helicase